MDKFMKAKISDKKIILDNTELRYLHSYRLEKESPDKPSKLTVTLYVNVIDQENS